MPAHDDVRQAHRHRGRTYRLSSFSHNIGRLFPAALRVSGSGRWVAALMGEEIFDVLQRDTMRDEELQPIVRQVMRIHVTEEARHIRYAREDLVRRLARANRANRVEQEIARYIAAQAGMILMGTATNPEVYRRAGLDPRTARQQALANRHYRENVAQHGFDRLRVFLEELDLIGGPTMLMWRRTGMVA